MSNNPGPLVLDLTKCRDGPSLSPWIINQIAWNSNLEEKKMKKGERKTSCPVDSD